MREVELINALLLGKGGIQIKMRCGRVCVVTRYMPSTQGTGMSLLEAATECAKKVLATCTKHPGYEDHIHAVILALDAYERRYYEE